MMQSLSNLIFGKEPVVPEHIRISRNYHKFLIAMSERDIHADRRREWIVSYIDNPERVLKIFGIFSGKEE